MATSEWATGRSKISTKPNQNNPETSPNSLSRHSYDTIKECFPWVVINPYSLLPSERCSVASISLFAVSLSPLGDRVAATLGVTPLLLGGASALVARGLSMIPTAFDIWKETKRPDASRGFPGLKALYIWTAGAAFSAAAVDFSLSAATMLPVGALIQNLALSTFATERFFQWKSKISKMT